MLSKEHLNGRVFLPLAPFKKLNDYVICKSAGTKAWVALTAGIVGYDVWAMLNNKETMSAAFGRAIDHPRKRWIVIVCWGLTTKHLFVNQVLHKYDPFNILALMVRGLSLIMKEKANGLANA